VNDGDRERGTEVGVGSDRNRANNIAIAHVDATKAKEETTAEVVCTSFKPIAIFQRNIFGAMLLEH
jgi:hypothetical protein